MEGEHNLLAGYQSARLAEVVPGAAHLGHGGEAELVQVIQDFIVQARSQPPQTGNIQALLEGGD